ncbi:CRISPR-associated protein Cas4 [Schlesneria sp. T3-172]|uniref:CRISPR-associated protein Cas4 n=1 Tax=Schlesneria sphaerica TaxID=3373610 RepID=UPI0037C72B6F
MAYSEDDLLPISALQHLLFCERQCALIHLERLWADNLLTAQGNHLHQKAHSGNPDSRRGVRTTRGLDLHSLTLGLAGQADVIEWEPPAGLRKKGQTLAQALKSAAPADRIHWRVTPVEYKRGQPKTNDCDRVQVCAQAICLEEMLGVTIPTAMLFYGQQRRRVDVPCDDVLRERTRAAAQRLHEMIRSRKTPPAVYEKKCDSCSLKSLCLPTATSRNHSAMDYLQRMLQYSEGTLSE